VSDFAGAVHAALVETDPARKCAAVAELPEAAVVNAAPPHDAGIPGRPPKPELIAPQNVPRRGFGTAAARAALVHAVAHIEFNAVNLALDACRRFAGLPPDYYRDWRSVAQDEARHFSMLSARLQELGSYYGAFGAHNGLWDAAEKTRHDVLERMALVPRVLEARGLDVTPAIIGKLEQAGDAATVAILRTILDEEVRHVQIGTRWFRFLCDARGLEPDATFARLVASHGMQIRRPLNVIARRAAGFSARELESAL
jgi:uncharacterized ferritin-like protein (DUF455 family)